MILTNFSMKFSLGSHNSWSYLPVRKWWMKPIAFMARCQSKTIQEQYKLGVRCFDLRVRYNRYGLGIVAHGLVEYCFTASRIYEDLAWLDKKGDCMVRVIHEVRSGRKHSEISVILFRFFCSRIKDSYGGIRFWCGRNLFDWQKDYDFGDDPSCEENYASVSCKWLAWWPWLYARLNNRKIIESRTDKDVLLIDYVNYGKDSKD